MERLTNNLNAANVSYLESMTHIHPNSSGSILLLEIPSLTAGQIIMSKHRSMYFGLGTGKLIQNMKWFYLCVKY